ncbi:MAG: transketolase C-terminal domain-containing protein [bacterium]
MNSNREIEKLNLICHEVRRRMFSTIFLAGIGHIGGCSSSVELMVCLYFGGILRFDPKDPRHPNRDRVLVRGHLSPLRYSIFSLLGWIDQEELTTYLSLGSRLQGHESMEHLPGVDITPSGMLGMVLSYGVGASIALKEQKIPATTWVFLGDGEEQEGNVSEAARYASHVHLSNLVCIMDRNRKQLAQPTSAVDSGSEQIIIWKGYGWSVKEIQDGHSVTEIMEVLQSIREVGKPTIFIANTTKGKGLESAKSHRSGYHTVRVCPKNYVAEAIAKEDKFFASIETGTQQKVIAERIKQASLPIPPTGTKENSSSNPFKVKFIPEVTDVFEEGLVRYLRQFTVLLQEHPEIRFYVLTADVTVKELVDQCGFNQPHIRYLDVGIREQHLVAMAHGISVTDPSSRIFIAGGDPFLFRATDQMHAISQASSKMVIMGSDSGICGAHNGSTHQTTGQPGALLSMPGMILLEPADTIDLANCLSWAFNAYPGPVYLRLHSGLVTPLPIDPLKRNLQAYVAYQPKQKVKFVIVTCGLPIEGAVNVAKNYEERGTGIKVVNVINMKELGHTFVELLEDGVPVLTVYNGNPFVLQSAVAKAVMEQKGPRPSVIKSHGFTIGTTGKLEELLKYFQLDADGIESVIKSIFP